MEASHGLRRLRQRLPRPPISAVGRTLQRLSPRQATQQPATGASAIQQTESELSRAVSAGWGSLYRLITLRGLTAHSSVGRGTWNVRGANGREPNGDRGRHRAVTPADLS